MVHVAASGHAAREMLSNEASVEIDLVPIDVQMLAVRGDDVRAELRGRAPVLRVAYSSGHARDLAADVVGIVEKPTAHAALLQSVRAFLDRPGG